MAEWLGVWILISRSWDRFRVAPDFFMMRRGSAHLVGTYRRCHVFVSLLVSTASVFLPVGKGWIKKFALLLLKVAGGGHRLRAEKSLMCALAF